MNLKSFFPSWAVLEYRKKDFLTVNIVTKHEFKKILSIMNCFRIPHKKDILNVHIVTKHEFKVSLMKGALKWYLNSDYAQTITKDESQRQPLLQVVQEHRTQHPGQSKSNFLNMNSVLLQI